MPHNNDEQGRCNDTNALRAELAVADEHVRSLVGERAALRAEVERIIAERDGYRNGNRDLHAECQRLRRERDDARNQIKCATIPIEAEVERMRRERDDAINQRRFGAVMAQQDYEEQVAALRAERDTAIEVGVIRGGQLGTTQRALREVKAEVERMRPVVEAALVQTNRVRIEGQGPCHCDCPACDGLEDAVDAYRASEQETTPSESSE